MPETIYLLLGSNTGDREKNLYTAIDKIESIPGLEIIATSAIYLSEAKDMEGDNPSFMNQVIMGDYLYLPNELLTGLEKIELNMGRVDKGKKKPRPIDIDILLFGDRIIKTEKLTIPHPELLSRSFAMVPLLQISPEIIHPKNKKPIANYLKKKDKEEVILYKEHVARNI